MTQSLCVLCGENEATTSDHIPPQGIYPKPRDNDIQFHTVPACRDCNGGTSKEDEEFKVAISLGTSSNRHDDKRLVDWVAKTIAHNKKLGKHVLENHKRLTVVASDGVQQGYVQVFFDSKAYNVVAQKVIRGLYWRETGSVLPKTAKIWIRPTMALDDKMFKSFVDVLSLQNERFLNKNTFSYRCDLSTPETTFWGCTFFGVHTFFAYIEVK
ncbi:TPA: hypothetical protein NJ265_003535 [Vibrio parahaemolyticus]|uniref:hypothetical protein n=1 Tax=Vibrio harveyi group TaxID=717610 RepID=UPI00111FF8F5|nr:hypothetical protein [Vibrio parahaemolyticus]ELB1510068.1 hypothetical protein [Vibrio alginolyticus]EJY0699859.1 hypothetical protein [Vibrio parahaemolyticus]EKB1969530.1 hypothetical protein [Vibrio parahaemolyticus]TOH02675.1 hypothetical protein CGI88_18490 [Vibrio parahaemolyticus]TOP89904.1 hypothetical protein CGH07_16590 [Vibrio parahaemolyticus]